MPGIAERNLSWQSDIGWLNTQQSEPYKCQGGAEIDDSRTKHKCQGGAEINDSRTKYKCQGGAEIDDSRTKYKCQGGAGANWGAMDWPRPQDSNILAWPASIHFQQDLGIILCHCILIRKSFYYFNCCLNPMWCSWHFEHIMKGCQFVSVVCEEVDAEDMQVLAQPGLWPGPGPVSSGLWPVCAKTLVSPDQSGGLFSCKLLHFNCTQCNHQHPIVSVPNLTNMPDVSVLNLTNMPDHRASSWFEIYQRNKFLVPQFTLSIIVFAPKILFFSSSKISFMLFLANRCFWELCLKFHFPLMNLPVLYAIAWPSNSFDLDLTAVRGCHWDGSIF